MAREVQVIRESILAALQESEDYRPADPGDTRRRIENSVRLGRLDPGQWAPEALVVAHTEDGLPNPYQHEFWERVAEIANGRGCQVYTFDVTHFTVGFFQEVGIPSDVGRWVERAAAAAAQRTRDRLEGAFRFHNISSPIEQTLYVCWEALRAELNSELDPDDQELSCHVLYPQFPVGPPGGKQYLLDFAVMRFDAGTYRRLVLEWRDRQDPYSDGNWVADPYPKEHSERCNLNLRVAIECDSYTHHVERLTAVEFEYQKRRERSLQAEGWTVFPFCGREINRDPIKCVKEVLAYLRRRVRESSPPGPVQQS